MTELNDNIRYAIVTSQPIFLEVRFFRGTLLKQAKVSVASFFDHRLESKSKFQGRRESGRKAGRNAGATIVIPLCGRNHREFGGRICRDLDSSRIRTDFHHGQATRRTRRQARRRFCREETTAPAAMDVHVKRNA